MTTAISIQNVSKARGRVASLLEVGTGFHPELTGRENIFLNGTILGMTKMKADAPKKAVEIVVFLPENGIAGKEADGIGYPFVMERNGTTERPNGFLVKRGRG